MYVESRETSPGLCLHFFKPHPCHLGTRAEPSVFMKSKDGTCKGASCLSVPQNRVVVSECPLIGQLLGLLALSQVTSQHSQLSSTASEAIWSSWWSGCAHIEDLRGFIRFSETSRPYRPDVNKEVQIRLVLLQKRLKETGLN